MKISARAPVRVDVAGGGTDAPPYCIDHGGAVINLSVARYAYASFERLPKGSGVILYSYDTEEGLRVDAVSELICDGCLDLMKVFVTEMIPDEKDFILTIHSEIPQKTGLGGSSSIGVAMVGVLSSVMGLQMGQEELALYAHEIEKKFPNYRGGSQDPHGAAVGGVKLISYKKGGGSSCEKFDIPERALYQLERDSLLIYTGDIHLSEAIHSDISDSYQLEDSPTVKAMDNLKAAALAMYEALKAGDLEVYVESLNKSRVNHFALHSSCDSDTLRKYFKTLDSFILGGKACGAGGGGFIYVLVKPDCRSECIQAAEDLGGMVWPFRLDREGVTVWEEKDSSAEKLAALIEKSKE